MGDLVSTDGSAAALGFGGITGAIVGYTAKKVTKVVAILLGLVFILIQVLVYKPDHGELGCRADDRRDRVAES